MPCDRVQQTYLPWGQKSSREQGSKRIARWPLVTHSRVPTGVGKAPQRRTGSQRDWRTRKALGFILRRGQRGTRPGSQARTGLASRREEVCSPGNFSRLALGPISARWSPAGPLACGPASWAPSPPSGPPVRASPRPELAAPRPLCLYRDRCRERPSGRQLSQGFLCTIWPAAAGLLVPVLCFGDISHHRGDCGQWP